MDGLDVIRWQQGLLEKLNVYIAHMSNLLEHPWRIFSYNYTILRSLDLHNSFIRMFCDVVPCSTLKLFRFSHSSINVLNLLSSDLIIAKIVRLAVRIDLYVKHVAQPIKNRIDQIKTESQLQCGILVLFLFSIPCCKFLVILRLLRM